MNAMDDFRSSQTAEPRSKGRLAATIGDPMDSIRHAFATVRHRKWLATGVFAIILALVLAYGFTRTKLYTASAGMVVNSREPERVGKGQGGPARPVHRRNRSGDRGRDHAIVRGCAGHRARAQPRRQSGLRREHLQAARCRPRGRRDGARDRRDQDPPAG
ncbi:hypothetical protein QP162_17100 [Sphingomonas aurantiaca]|uniref:hypothetical protein n=1 Tax=Sphingomonas aurantiaca TaxID=185949 RepID=UPI002FE24B5E